jgi:hypothetical protein
MSWSRNLASGLYSAALRLYPAAFRARYADEMVRVFGEGLRDARAAGPAAAVRYGLRTGLDLLASALRERLTAIAAREWLAGFAAVACGCGIAWVDFRATEVPATLLALLTAGFALGCFFPKLAWRSAFIAAACLPAIHLVALALSRGPLPPGHPYFSRFMILLPALAASFLGAAAGLLLRNLSRLLAK